MAEARSQAPASYAAINDFVNYLEKCTIESYDKREFVCMSAVRTYLKKDDYQQLKDILHALFENINNAPNYETIVLGNFKYIAIFCILIEIQKGAQIREFLTKDLHDGKLPFNRDKRHDDFPPILADDYERFCDTQWKFYAPFFPGMQIPDQNPLRVLPIINKTDLNEGGTAKLYKIEIHGCYHCFHDKTGEAPEEHHHFNSTSSEILNTFVLKTFAADTFAEYESEVDAYSRLGVARKHQHIVNFYGNFTQNGTHNIILELADKGSLEEYFDAYDPPVESSDITKFWKNLLGIFHALHAIHTIEVKGSNIASTWSKGWHQDVKPDNILIFSNGATSQFEYTFKLADFGLCKFKQMKRAGNAGTVIDAYGTSRYGAPECCRPGSGGYIDEAVLKVEQSVDIWSFGCVLSEAAVWMSKNYEGVTKYREERENATESTTKLGDCFHDGTKVSDTVLHWHQKVRDTLRRSDNVTAMILKEVEDYMLVEDPDRRHEAIKLLKNLNSSLEAGQASSSKAGTSLNYSDTNPQPNVIISNHSSTPSSGNYLGGNPVSIPADYSRLYPETERYLHKQEQTFKEIENEIATVNSLLSMIVEAEKMLERRIPKKAYEKFKAARNLKDSIKGTNLEKEKKALDGEVDLKIWVGLANCHLQMAGSGGENKKKHLENAQSYARRVQLIEDPKGKESKALEFMMTRSRN